MRAGVAVAAWLAVSIVVVASTASAQEVASPDAGAPQDGGAPPDGSAQPDAGALPDASTPAPDGAPPEDARHVEADHAIARGEAFFQRENYDAALSEFEHAYQLLAGDADRYLLLFNVGQCHERRFRYDLALQYYQRYLDEGGPDAEDRATVEGTMRALDGLLATIDVRINVRTAQVWLDERRIGDAPGTFRIPGGRHVLELRGRGFVPARRELDLAARARSTVVISLELLSHPRRLSPAFFWSGVAATGVVALGGTVVGVLALLARSDVDARLADDVRKFGVTPEDQVGVQHLALATDIVFGVAAGLAIATTVIYFLTDFGGRRGARALLAPAITPTYAGWVLDGRF